MRNRTFVLTAAAVAVGALLTAASTQAAWSPLTRINYLTFSGAVALPGVVLSAGTYTFESGPSSTHPDIVRVTTRDGRRTLYMGLTTPVRRVDTRKTEVSFGEAAAGQPQPISRWFPTGSTHGHQFRYR